MTPPHPEGVRCHEQHPNSQTEQTLTEHITRFKGPFSAQLVWHPPALILLSALGAYAHACAVGIATPTGQAAKITTSRLQFVGGGVLVAKVKRCKNDVRSSHPHARPTVQAAQHHRVKCVGAGRARRVKAENAASVGTWRAIHSKGDDWRFGVGVSGGDITTRHHQMLANGCAGRKRKMRRGVVAGVKVLAVDVVENAGVDFGAWCISTTKHHQTIASGKLSMSK